MKLRRSSAIRKKVNRVKKLDELKEKRAKYKDLVDLKENSTIEARSSPCRKRDDFMVPELNESKEKRAKDKDVVDKENLTIKTRSSPLIKIDDFKVMVSESESEESIQEGSKRKSQRLHISVAETESEDGIESIDMFDEEEEESGPGETSGLVSLGSRKPPRNPPRKRQDISDIDDSDTDNYFDAFENVNEENEGTGKEDSPRSSSLTDEEEVDDVDKTEVYSLKPVLVPLEDIGGLLKSYSNGRLTKDWMFSISRSKTSKYRQSSSSSSEVSSNSDPNDDDFSLSESSNSDSEESSSSGSNFSWESECESISSSNSWLPKRYISSSEEDSDSTSELEEIEDDFVLHTKNTRELRKKKYALRQSNGAIRKKVAKYCNEEIEESTSIDSSDSDV